MVAAETFRSKQKMIYIRSILRAVAKGLAAEKLKSSLFDDDDEDDEEEDEEDDGKKKKKKKKDSAGEIFGRWLAKTAISVGVAATEQADLRCWRTMPSKCLVGEFEVPPGKHHVEVQFLDANGGILQRTTVADYQAGKPLNLIQANYIN